MEKGINLALTKSLVDFDSLLKMVIMEISSKNMEIASENMEIFSKKLLVVDELADNDSWKFQVGNYVYIYIDDGHGNGDPDENPPVLFWIGVRLGRKRCT